MVQRVQRAGEALSHLGRMLDSLSPLATLQRGYAILYDREGAVVTDARSVSCGDEVEARLAKGRLGLTVSRVEPGPE
jgi:exodeoxyribonuclease VII large subunit